MELAAKSPVSYVEKAIESQFRTINRADVKANKHRYMKPLRPKMLYCFNAEIFPFSVKFSTLAELIYPRARVAQ